MEQLIIQIIIENIEEFTKDELLQTYKDIEEITEEAKLKYKRNKPWGKNERYRDLGTTILVRGKIKK